MQITHSTMPGNVKAIIGLLLLILVVFACQVPAQRVVCPRLKANEKKPWIVHHPPVPQARRTPIPIYAEVQPGTGIDTVYLFYRGTGQKAFERFRMDPYRSGFAYYISCMRVWEPRVEYYIVATGGDCVLATAGTAESPLETKVVTRLNEPGPALPGEQAPFPCVEVDCPPGISKEDCENPLYRAQGEACKTNRDCQPGLMCKKGLCVFYNRTLYEGNDKYK